MSDTNYPSDAEIKVQWTLVHWVLLAISLLALPAFFLVSPARTTSHLLSLVGLQLGAVGVVISSLKTPPYGQFLDGGLLEFKRSAVEKKYFQCGMWIIAAGFILQAWAAL